MTKAPPRLFIDMPLVCGSVITLQKSHAHYLQNVLRLKTGAVVSLFNGIDGEWHGSLIAGINSVSVEILALRQPQQEPYGPGLMFTPLKKGPVEFLVQKATELGVSDFLPTITDFTDVKRFNFERIEAIVIEAAEQCGRLTIPKIEQPKKLNERLQLWPKNTTLIFAAEAGPAKPIDEALRESKKDNTLLKWVLAVGPVGGFSPAEHTLLRGLSYAIPIGLGPRLLRAETAAVATLSCWQSIMGDWTNRPIDRSGE